MSSALGALLALAIAIVGIVVVRPVHATAGLILAGGGAARFVGIGLASLLGAARESAGMSHENFGILNALLSLGMTVIYWGSIGAAAWMLARELGARGGRRV